MKGQEPEQKLITLLPTENLKKQFQKIIESYVKATKKEKTLSREEMEQLLVRKLLEMTNPNSEYDTLLFQKVKKVRKYICLWIHPSCQKTSTVYHFESKAMKIDSMDEKSLKQLEYVKQRVSNNLFYLLSTIYLSFGNERDYGLRFLGDFFLFQEGIHKVNGAIREGQGMAGTYHENAEHEDMEACWLCCFPKY